MNLVIVSPHRDDAAFSLSIAFMQWLKDAHTITLLNCFTRTAYAPWSDVAWSHPNDRISYVSAMRRKEDEVFLRSLPGFRAANITMKDLNLKDAPIRRRCLENEVCALALDHQDPAIEKIRRSLSRLEAEQKLDLLVLPLALGRHVDHLTARAAALPFSHSRPSAFYEDLPYATRSVGDEDLAEFRAEIDSQFHEPLVAHLTHVEEGVRAKRRLVLGYTSQINEEEGDGIANFANRYGEGERLWCNAAWIALASSARLSVEQTTLERPPA